MVVVQPIVEGHTEAQCVERILQRVWTQLLAVSVRLQVLKPSRCPRDALLNSNLPDLAKAVAQGQIRLLQQLRRQPGARGFLLILVDAEEDCPAMVAPDLLHRARAARSDADVACVLAKRNLENWFKAAAASLAGVAGLPANLTVPANPEDGSGDTWLTRQMRTQNPRRKYTKPADAAELAQRMDLQQCRTNSPSFDELCRELEARLPKPENTRTAEESATPGGDTDGGQPAEES